jgi:hypothetical protein
MGWRVSKGLLALRNQIDVKYPKRRKDSDGTIGDQAHQGTTSDHNPDWENVVRALDITHDPDHGCDIDRLSDWLQAGRDPRIEYVIANHLIMNGNGYADAWEWNKYYGIDPHTNHMHVSTVSDDSIADNESPWFLGGVDMSVESDMTRVKDIIEAWNNGVPTADGIKVCPVVWQIEREKWEAAVMGKIDKICNKLGLV